MLPRFYDRWVRKVSIEMITVCGINLPAFALLIHLKRQKPDIGRGKNIRNHVLISQKLKYIIFQQNLNFGEF